VDTSVRRLPRRLWVTLEYAAFMGVVTMRSAQTAVDWYPGWLDHPSTYVSFAVILSALVCLAFDLILGRPPRSRAVGALIALPFIVGCGFAFVLTLASAPLWLGPIGWRILTTVVLPAVYAFRRILWLGRDGSATPQPALDPSASRG
jgi:hypothetical protein